MAGFENADKNLVENPREAAEAAYAEKKPREWLAEHKTELSEDQQKALEWFATAEGEKALGNYREEQEKQKELVRQKAWEIIIGPFNKGSHFPREFPEGKNYPSIKELIKSVMNKSVEEILQEKGSFGEKVDRLNRLASSLYNGAYLANEGVDSVYVVGRSTELAKSKNISSQLDILRGAMATALTFKDYFSVAGYLNNLLEDEALKSQLIEDFADYLGAGHEQKGLNEIMNKSNYVFNPEKNRYEKVE